MNVNTSSGRVVGQQLAGASQPVVLTAIQIAQLAQDATLTGGAAQAQVKSGLKGASTTALVTSTANGADHQGLDVAEQFGAGAEDNTNGVFAISKKPLATNTYAASFTGTVAGTVTKLSVKGSAGNVLSISATNTHVVGSDRFLLLKNKATAMVATDVPDFAFQITSLQTLMVNEGFFVGSGGFFSLGITWAISTTTATFTDSATAGEHTVCVHYK